VKRARVEHPCLVARREDAIPGRSMFRADGELAGGERHSASRRERTATESGAREAMRAGKQQPDARITLTIEFEGEHVGSEPDANERRHASGIFAQKTAPVVREASGSGERFRDN
jgi:hypothetical protein